jgi:hypothetical protein
MEACHTVTSHFSSYAANFNRIRLLEMIDYREPQVSQQDASEIRAVGRKWCFRGEIDELLNAERSFPRRTAVRS